MKIVNGTSYHDETPDELVRALEAARLAGYRVRLHYGKDGVDWLEENDVEGRLGRSAGPVKVPILLANRRSDGGGAILDHCVVKVRRARGGEVLWQAPGYRAPTVEVRDGALPGFPREAYVDGELHARFKSQDAASRWLGRMGIAPEVPPVAELRAALATCE